VKHKGNYDPEKLDGVRIILAPESRFGDIN
jgi:hypothetical protein